MNTTTNTESAATAAVINPALLIIGLVLGAVVGMGGVAQLDPVITMPEELGSWPISPTPEYTARYNKAYSNMWMGNLAINFALIGTAAGAMAAIVFARGASATSRLLMVILSLLGGGLGGLLTGRMLASAHSTQGRLDLFGWSLDPMLQSVLFQTVVWAGIGMGVGAAVALSQRQSLGKGLAGGLIGGFAAAVVHALLGSIIFPNSDMANLLPPNPVEQFIWVAYSAACIGIGIWWPLRPSAPRAVA